MNRRYFSSRSLATVVGFLLMSGLVSIRCASVASTDLVYELTRIEKASGGRLGVAVLDTDSKQVKGLRMNERFPMCSTFKVLAVSALLAQVDAGHEQLSRRIKFTEADLIAYSPTTKNHVGGEGMTLAELCEAAITLSDNTASNLILQCVGGPAGVTTYARSIGDTATRLDRNEPALNRVQPGDPRDTTTPAAMLADLEKLVLGDVLSSASRQQLIAWLKATKTGDERLRAGLPKDWQVGDKTGTSNNTANDIAVIWPPNRLPIMVTAFLTDTTASPERCNKSLATVGRAVAAEMNAEAKSKASN